MRNSGLIITNPDSNLDNYPPRDADHPANLANQITIGDLHGNALKLIYTLIRQNILNVSEADYDRIQDIYKKDVDALTKNDLQSFNAILSRITANPSGMLRLIGDELADRGSNDLWTFQILKRLKELEVPVEVIISNHTLGFLDGHAKGDFSTRHYSPASQTSMANLKKLIDKGLVSKEEVDRLVRETHQPLLKALSYSISPDGNGITIYSHAPIDFATIEDMAEKLKIEYRDNSIKELAKTIEQINEKFQQQLPRGTIFE